MATTTFNTSQVMSVVHWGIGLAMTVVGSLETAHVFAGSTVGGAVLAGAGPVLIAVERYLSVHKAITASTVTTAPARTTTAA